MLTQLIVTHLHGVGMTHGFTDPAAARTAYNKLKEAMASFQRFKNDNTLTVEIDTLGGNSVFKVEDLLNVSICEDDPLSDYSRAKVENMKRERQLYIEAGLSIPKHLQ